MSDCASDLSVSAVVANYNGGQRVLNTIASLVEQTYPLNGIIVVDNASTDDSVEQIRQQFSEVEIVSMSDNLGVSAARNAGLRKAESDYALLLDGDMIVTEGCIGRLLAACQEHQAAAACPRIRLNPQRDIVQADGAEAHFLGTLLLRHAYTPIDQLDDQPAEVGGGIGAVYLVDRGKALEIGGFCEPYFIYFEDLEFSIHLRAKGRRFVCEPRAEVFHDRGGGTPGLSFRGQGGYPARRAFLTMRNRLLTMLIHYRVRTLFVLAPALALYELATLILAVLRGWLKHWFAAWGWIIRHNKTVRSLRKNAQAGRTVRDRDLFVGGDIPLTPGLLKNRLAAALVRMLSATLNGYWRFACRWID